MRPPDWKAALNAAANAAIIAASAAVLLAVWMDLRWRQAVPAPPAPVPSLRIGAKAPAIAGIDYARSRRTLVLFMSVHCAYCRTAVPFFRDLAASLAPASGGLAKARILAVFPDDAVEVSQFGERENFQIEAASGLPLQSIGVGATPTAVLVSRSGRGSQIWQGAPGKAAQDAIRGALTAGP